MTISVSKHSVDDTPKAPTRWAVFAQFVATLFNPSFTQRILTPQFLSMIYGLLMVTVTLGMAYGVLLAAQQSWLWGGLAVILMPIGLLAAIAVIRLLFEVVVLFSRLIVDIHAVAAMQQPLAQIAQMSEPLSEIALGVRDMNTDIKTIAQMYSSIHRISSVTDNLETIAGMYEAIHKLASITDHVEEISSMRHTIDLLPQLSHHIETIAAMRPSIDKIAELTDNIEIIADMRDSIDKISEIGEVVSKLRRTPFMRSSD